MIESEFFVSTMINLIIDLIYTVSALIVALIALVIVDKILLKSFRIEAELKKGNMALAVFASTILIFVAIIVSFGLKG
jgi:uncharacterized membrane protein YjfL (UPF0719 family)